MDSVYYVGQKDKIQYITLTIEWSMQLYLVSIKLLQSN